MEFSEEELEIIKECLKEHTCCEVEAFYNNGYDREKYEEEREKLRIKHDKRFYIVYKINNRI